MNTATIRMLRNSFPKVRKMLETKGEVLLTERGKAKYRLERYAPPSDAEPAPVDYFARLTASQPAPMTARQARSLHDENRGNR